jgi:hypothetical protein
MNDMEIIEGRLRKSIVVHQDCADKWRILVNAENGPSLHSGDDELAAHVKNDNLIKSLIEIIRGDYE